MGNISKLRKKLFSYIFSDLISILQILWGTKNEIKAAQVDNRVGFLSDFSSVLLDMQTNKVNGES